MGNLITPTVGVVYSFTFESAYAKLNGIYRVDKLMTYDEYLADGGNILTDFYTPAEADADLLAQELANIRESKIMKLTTVDTSVETVTYFAPLCLVSETPDYHVNKYVRFGIVSYIGITDDPTTLDYVKENLEQQFLAALGITPDSQFIITGETWLTDTGYAEEVAKRDKTKKSMVNYYSENIRLQKALASANARNKVLETLAINLQKQVDKLKESSGG